MLNFKKCLIMLDAFIDKDTLTTEELNNLGFSSHDLAKLVETGEIKRVKRGVYIPNNPNGFLIYYKNLGNKTVKNYKRQSQCIERCYERWPDNASICFWFLVDKFRRADFMFDILPVLDVLSMTVNPYYLADFNTYLSLLSEVMELPEKYRKLVETFQFSDMEISCLDNRYTDADINKANEIRRHISHKDFYNAYSSIHNYSGYKNLLILFLINRIHNRDFQIWEQTKVLVQNGNYQQLVSYLTDLSGKYTLNYKVLELLEMGKDFLSIQETKMLPTVVEEIPYPSNLHVLIKRKDYRKAIDVLRKSQSNNFGTMFGLALVDINQLIHSVELENARKNSSVCVEEEKEGIQNNADFSEIIQLLLQEKLDEAFQKLDSYLTVIEKGSYKGFIIDLIKLSLKDKDLSFEEVITTLTELSHGDYQFDVSGYVFDFYSALASKNFDKAEILLDIISKSKDLGGVEINTEDFSNSLRKLNPAFDDSHLKESKVVPNEAFESSDSVCNSNQQSSNYISSNDDAGFWLEVIRKSFPTPREKLFAKVNNVVNSKGLVILDASDGYSADQIFRDVIAFPQIQASYLSDEERRKVVLMYHEPTSNFVDFKELISKGNQAYRNNQFSEASSYFSEVLARVSDPKPFLFSSIGLCYKKLGIYDTAMNYFMVGKESAKRHPNNFDFDYQISYIKQKLDFREKQLFNPVIQCFEHTSGLVFSHDLGFSEACRQFQLNVVQTAIFDLFLAREAYKQGNYRIGDRFVCTAHDLAKTSFHPNQYVNALMEEVVTNRENYRLQGQQFVKTDDKK